MKRYANVRYEYVGYDCSWDDMQRMLLDGEIDMVTSAHKTAGREALFDFSAPIGTNSVQLNTRADNERFIAGQYDTYNGMTIGLVTGSSVNEKVAAFAQENGFTCSVKEYPGTEALEAALVSGEIDAIATSSLRRTSGEKTLSEFGSESFYAIVRKGDTELLSLINTAIEQMDASEGDWRNTLYYQNYGTENGTTLIFTSEERDYIAAHSEGGEKVIFATDNAWIPFISLQDGEYVGIIPDLIDRIMAMTGMRYEYRDPGADIFVESELHNGEVDLYLGYFYDVNLAEQNGYAMTSPFMTVEACRLTRKDAQQIRTVALSEVNPRLNGTLTLDADQTVLYYTNAQAAVEAVRNGKADAAYLYSFEGEYYQNRDGTGTLVYTAIPGTAMQLCAIASENADRTLVSIMSKCINTLTDSEVETIVSRNVTVAAQELTLTDYATMHPITAAVVLGIAVLVLVVILSILGRNQAQRKYHAEREAWFLAEQEKEQRYQAELKQARDAAEAASRAKTDFLFSMSHDIRTPMNAILGYCALMEKYEGDREKCADYLKKIRSSGDLLLELINNVLEMARIESGAMALDETTLNVHEVNDSLFNVFDEQMRTKGIRYSRTIDVQHDYVFCDSLKVR